MSENNLVDSDIVEYVEIMWSVRTFWMILNQKYILIVVFFYSKTLLRYDWLNDLLSYSLRKYIYFIYLTLFVRFIQPLKNYKYLIWL